MKFYLEISHRIPRSYISIYKLENLHFILKLILTVLAFLRVQSSVSFKLQKLVFSHKKSHSGHKLFVP